ncbi:MAG TPA: hypothetical protein VFH56_14335 [Acidimicrobiales bacterium]|nr:hypothetical protein [Acidimicrobiales bacterium]
MSEKFEVGDRVRVTIETTVTDADTADCICTRSGRLTGIDILDYVVKDGGTVEKIEPPVETFGPGTYVRHKAATDMKFLVLDNGYVDLQNNLCWRDCTDSFTSKDYERIEMAEVPL